MFGFPLLLIPLAICNIIVFLMNMQLSDPAQLFSVALMSRDIWVVTLSDVIVALTILLLLLEIMRAARPASKYFMDHFLSLVVFGVAAAEFVMLPKFGNSTFFLVTLVALVDFLAGVSLRTRRSRRVVATAPVADPPAPVAVPVPAPAPVVNREPTFTPAPAPPPMTPVAHETIPLPPPVPTASDLQARVEPIVPDTTTAEPKREADSPKIVSPGLAPAGAAHQTPDSPQRS